MLVRDSLMLHRQDDPSNEYREVILYQSTDGPYGWQVWECVSFLSDPDTHSRSRRAEGSASDMGTFFHTLVEGLLKDGFVICLPEDITSRRGGGGAHA